MTSINTSLLSRPAGMLAMVSALALLAGCGSQSQSHQMPPAAVGVVVVQPQQVPLTRSATGRVSAHRSADVRARVSGVLLQRTYNEGTHVDKGQVLFKIDPAPLKATLNAAEASLAQARATYTNNHVSAKRIRKLAPKGYVSQADLDNAEAAERSALAAVKAAKAQVENAKINLGYATVRAPIAGRAGKQQVTEGALVGQGSATLLTTVRQIDPVYLNFSLPVSELQQIRAEQASGKTSQDGKTTVHITLPDGSTYPQTGTLDFAGASVDPSTGAVTLRALIPNPKHVLLPGMYAQMEVNLGAINHAYLIPQNAIQRDASSAYVLTVGKGNKVVRKNVVTGHMDHGNWIVTKGIDPGDRVIVSGIPKAKPGAEVKPTVESSKPAANAGHAAKPGAAAPAASTAQPSKAKGHPATTASKS